MNDRRLLVNGWGARILAALVFLGVGSLIILVFSPWRPILKSDTADYLGRIGLTAGLLVVAALSRKSPRLEKFHPLMVGLFILSLAVTVDVVFGNYLILKLGASDTIPAGWTAQKVNEAFLVISVVLLSTLATGGSLGSIYFQKGNLKSGLMIGGIAFVLAAAGSFPMAALFKAQNLTLARVVPWIPWLLAYVLANAAMEEIMFRGLFLRKLEPFMGTFLSNFLTAFVFTGLHGTVTYSADNMLFLAVTFPLALAWGYIMQKTDSVWGSILFHAGMDIPIMLGIFSGLP